MFDRKEVLRALSEATFEAIAIHEKGKILYANQAMASLFGYDPAEIVGMDALDLAAPESRDLVRQNILSNYKEPYEAVGLRKDGSTFIGELRGKSIIYQRHPVRVTTIRDITERKQAEERLRQSEERYRRLVEISPDGIALTDLDINIILCNQRTAELHGFESPEEVVGKKAYDLIAPEDRQRSMENAMRALKTGSIRNVEYTMLRKDGSRFCGELSASVIYDGHGNPTSFIGVVRDISDRKELEKQFYQSQKMQAIGQLAGGIAHDFNNLLMVIRGHGEVLQERLTSSGPEHVSAEEINRAVDRAALLIDQLLAFSRAREIQPQVLDLNDVVADMFRMLRRLLGENIEMTAIQKTAAAYVLADPAKLQQVLLNLVVNSRDAMPQGGRIIIRTETVFLDERYARTHPEVQPGQYVVLSISDTGSGMDTETRSRIFEPFFTTKEPGMGSGLGLATVYGIVIQSDGHIQVESRMGQGTTFRVYFPRVKEPACAAEPSSSPSPDSHGTETVLLVEDEKAVRDLIARSLRAHGYTVLEAGDGAEALQLSHRHDGPLHLLLTDLAMPRMDGHELATRLTALRPDLKVITMSGFTGKLNPFQEAPDLGLVYLPKPCSLETLVRKVRKVLDSSPISNE